MRHTATRPLILALTLVVLAGSAQSAETRWIHVTVDEADGAKVTVNLPLALAERALPMLPFHDELNWRNFAGDHGVELEEMREIWNDLRNGPDMTFVTVEEDDETVKVWKEKGTVYVEVRGDAGQEHVDVRVPIEVVDALLGGDEINVEAALDALVRSEGGDLVSVRDRDDNVRVWIDDTPEAANRSNPQTR